MSNLQLSFILKDKIKYKCVVCKNAMHGSICGAETSTISSIHNVLQMLLFVTHVSMLPIQKKERVNDLMYIFQL
jgi:hypothetical protein